MITKGQTTARERFEFVEKSNFKDLNIKNYNNSLELNEFDVNTATLPELRRFVATLCSKIKGD